MAVETRPSKGETMSERDPIRAVFGREGSAWLRTYSYKILYRRFALTRIV
jgi:hypothetical protein